MRRPNRFRNACLVLMLIGVTAGLAAIAMGDLRPVPVAQMVLGVAGLMLVPIPFFFLIYFQVETLRQQRLLAGRDVIARWRVDEARWREFVRLNDVLNQRKDSTPCEIPDAAVPRPEGVEVIVGKAAVMIGEDFHSLPRHGISQIYGPYWIEGPPACMEFLIVTSGKNGTSRECVRVPTAAGAEKEAVAAFEHYKAYLPQPAALPPRNFPRIRNVTLMIGLVLGAAAAGVVLNVPYFQEHKEYQVGAMITGVVGAMGFVGCLLIALMCQLLHMQERRRGAKA